MQERVRFGKTGLMVSPLTLGTWGMGGAGWDQYDDATRIDAIAAAIECGINFIDTAPAYNAGAAERLLGKTLKDLGARDQVVISTKCGNVFKNPTTYVRDGSAAGVTKQVEDSLVNLQTDHIDLMLIHWPDPNVPFEETMGALNKLKDAGKILHIGVSNFSVEQMQEISKFGDIEAYQPHYSMVNRTAEPIIRYAHEQDMGIMSYGSLGGGILTGAIRELKTYDPGDSRNRFYKHFQEPTFSRVMELLKVMDGISAKNGKPLSQIALNWSLSRKFITTCIVGAQTRKKVQENAAVLDWKLTDEERRTLDDAIAQYLGD